MGRETIIDYPAYRMQLRFSPYSIGDRTVTDFIKNPVQGAKAFIKSRISQPTDLSHLRHKPVYEQIDLETMKAEKERALLSKKTGTPTDGSVTDNGAITSYSGGSWVEAPSDVRERTGIRGYSDVLMYKGYGDNSTAYAERIYAMDDGSVVMKLGTAPIVQGQIVDNISFPHCLDDKDNPQPSVRRVAPDQVVGVVRHANGQTGRENTVFYFKQSFLNDKKKT